MTTRPTIRFQDRTTFPRVWRASSSIVRATAASNAKSTGGWSTGRSCGPNGAVDRRICPISPDLPDQDCGAAQYDRAAMCGEIAHARRRQAADQDGERTERDHVGWPDADAHVAE